MPSFDWYQATVRASADDVIAGLLESSDRRHLVHGRGVQRYATITKLVGDDDNGQVEVWHGGDRQANPHVRFTSDAAPGHVAILRRLWPDSHSPSRIDVKEDFDGAGVFDAVLPSLVDVARRHRVKVDAKGDHYLTLEGRTISLGSRSSAVMLRVYDKAAEMRAKAGRDPVRLLHVPDHLTRFEVEVKPPSDPLIRRAMAHAEPGDFLGASKVVREAWQAFGGQDVAPMRCTKAWRATDEERAYSAMLSQYGGLLARMAADQGWPELGLQLRDDLAAREQAKRRSR